MGGKVRARCSRSKCDHQEDHPARTNICPRCGSTWNYYALLYLKGERYWAGADELGRTITDPRTAQDILGVMRYEINRGKFDPSRYKKKAQRKFRFSEAVKAHLAYERHRLSVGEIREATYHGKEFKLGRVLPLAGSSDIRDIEEFRLEQWSLELLRTLAPSRVRDIFQAVHSFLKWAKRNRLIDSIPDMPGVKLPPAATKEWLDEAAQHKILDQIPWEIRGIWICLIYQACRISEAAALDWSDVDLINETMTIRRSIDWTSMKIYPTKTRKNRDLAIHPEFITWLKAHRSIGLIFRYHGEIWKKSTLYDVWRRACRAAGVPYISLYQATRHSWASQKAAEGHNIFDISQVLGHTNVKTTLRYTHPSLEASRRTILGTIEKLQKEKSNENNTI